MSDITAEMLKDMLNDIERNVYEGFDIRQDVTAAYALVDELGNERDQLKDENSKLREFAHGLIDGYECGRGELCEGCTWDGMSDPREFNCNVRAEARELGIEVSK